ncbi:BatA domain-containing protein [Bacteroidales bacterium OttesenSCG-928-C19]|nr:BatA domain-containing protein [Bacteroidales bacterium OttesenSCG-928-C19]
MQFLNPLFLIGVIAVAIPIIIHLFNFRRVKKVYFSNVEFLQAIQSQKHKISNLKHIIILCLRILTVICLVFAFARPFIPKKDKPIIDGVQYVNVYLDNSFSMQMSSTNGFLLDEAKQKAKEIANAYKPSDKFQLITNNLEGKHQRYVSKDDFLNFIEDVDYSSASVPMSFVLRKQIENTQNISGGKRNIYLISDFQKNITDVENFPHDTVSEAVWIVPLRGNKVNNIYIDSIWFDFPFFHQGNPVTVYSKIVNAGTEPIEKVPVKLNINNNQRAVASVDLKAGESSVVPLNFTITEQGILQAEISISDYPVVFDDNYYFSILVQEQTPVMVISGSSPNKYIDRLFAADSAFRYYSITENRLEYDKLNSQNFIVLNELERISSGLTKELQTFVEDGGSLFVIPSEKTDPTSYEQAFASMHIPLFSEWIAKESKVISFNNGNSLYKGVFDKEPENIELPMAFRYWRMQIPQASSTEVLMMLQTGDPFLTATSIGKGKVYVLCSPAQSEFNNFASQQLFVPTLFNMALFSKPSAIQSYDIDYPNAIEIDVLSNEKDFVLKMRSLDKKTEVIPELTRRNGKTYIFLRNQFSTAGNYEIMDGDNVISGLSLNYNRRESDQEAYSQKELKDQLDTYGFSQYQIIRTPEKSLDVVIKEQYASISLWRWFIILALLSILTEILLLRFWRV